MRIRTSLVRMGLSLLAMYGIGSASSQAADSVELSVMNPIATIEVQRIVPVARPVSLDNKRILLYWNRKLHADFAVDEIRKHLQERVKGAEYAIVQGTAWQPEPGFYEEILNWKPDVVIASTGD